MSDKDYDYAIRLFLDNILSPVFESEERDLNVVKPMVKYIGSRAGDGFLFSSPMFAWWNLTPACNLRCIHCLYNATSYSSKNDLSTQKAMALAEELIDIGIVQIILTGGEIFLRKDVFPIIKKFKENNVSVKLLTNATLINECEIKQLAGLLNPYTDTVQISLDGATPETYEKIRLINALDKVVNNIKILTNLGLRVAVAYTANKVNVNEAVMLYKLCNNLGVKEFLAGKMLIHNESHSKLSLSQKEHIFLIKDLLLAQNDCPNTKLRLGFIGAKDLLNTTEAEKIINEEKYSVIFNSPKSPLNRTCHSHDRIFVQSDGKVYMCMETECEAGLLGDYQKNSLLEIWQNRSSNLFFQPRVFENMGCHSCKYNKFCNSGCMARAYANFGDINMPDSYCKHLMAH